MKGEIFIASSVSEPGMIQAIELAFEGSGLKTIYGQEAGQRALPLSERIDQIRRSRVGIYDLSTPSNDEIFLKLGIALGLGREVIVIQKKGPLSLNRFDPLTESNTRLLLTFLKN